MTLPIPVRHAPDSTFEWTLFESRYAVGRNAGYSVQPVRWQYFTGTNAWTEYVEGCRTLATRLIAKGAAPGIIHGDCDGWHDNDSVKTCCALVIDCDRAPLAEADIDGFLDTLGEVRYLFQWRKNKFHLVLPLAEPLLATDLQPHQVSARRAAAIEWFAGQWGRQLDGTTATAAAILHPYSRREVEDATPITRDGVGPSFDLEALLGRIGFREAARRTATPKQGAADGNVVIEGLTKASWVLDLPRRGNGGQPICCPFHPDEAQGDTSTVVFPSGYIHCMHDRCRNRMQIEYLAKIPGLEPHGDLSAEMRLALESVRRNPVGLPEARDKIWGALAGTHPWERTATIVRVTTGAGKTRCAAEYLDAYCAPQLGEAGELLPGRTAFMGMPTNDLMREVSERLNVAHRKATGVLAVLNDAGSPACKKWAIASGLQQAGGDVHRLMCAGCEYRDGCPAREGTRSGEGSLTLTNHTLLPALVGEAREAGRTPLVVWDESPPFVESIRVTSEDLQWFINRFDSEDVRGRAVLDQLDRPDLFSDRFRICWRPLIEVMRRLPGQSFPEALAEYGSIRLSEAHLSRAEGLLGAEGARGLWNRVRAVASEARRVNVAEQMFDQLSPEAQRECLRASGVQRFLEAIVAARPESVRLTAQPGAWLVSRVTTHGDLWRLFGGVVLDATAPIHDLLALRPDARVIDIDVEDSSGILRVVLPRADLGRTRLAKFDAARRAEVVGSLVTDIGEQLAALKRKLKRHLKVLVVTYRNLKQDFIGVWNESGDIDVRYYGNIRGYDEWFQNGFDAFVTVGDPYTDIGVDGEAYCLLGIEGVELDEYFSYKARAELAQAHGRARDCQPKRADGLRMHVHVGRLAPLGWDKEAVIG